ncbi:MAG: hypothetical protein AAF196_11725 [Planctomycetota bacterium]
MGDSPVGIRASQSAVGSAIGGVLVNRVLGALLGVQGLPVANSTGSIGSADGSSGSTPGSVPQLVPGAILFGRSVALPAGSQGGAAGPALLATTAGPFVVPDGTELPEGQVFELRVVDSGERPRLTVLRPIDLASLGPTLSPTEAANLVFGAGRVQEAVTPPGESVLRAERTRSRPIESSLLSTTKAFGPAVLLDVSEVRSAEKLLGPIAEANGPDAEVESGRGVPEPVSASSESTAEVLVTPRTNGADVHRAPADEAATASSPSPDDSEFARSIEVDLSRLGRVRVQIDARGGGLRLRLSADLDSTVETLRARAEGLRRAVGPQMPFDLSFGEWSDTPRAESMPASAGLRRSGGLDLRA